MTKKYGPVRYIDDFVNAPSSAKFIVRYVYGDFREGENFCSSIVLEKYYGSHYYERIKEFPYNALSKYDYKETLRQCRECIGTNDLIWVERPEWM